MVKGDGLLPVSSETCLRRRAGGLASSKAAQLDPVCRTCRPGLCDRPEKRDENAARGRLKEVMRRQCG